MIDEFLSELFSLQGCVALCSGVLGPLDWVETRALSDGVRALADLEQGKTAAPRTLLRPRD